MQKCHHRILHVAPCLAMLTLLSLSLPACAQDGGGEPCGSSSCFLTDAGLPAASANHASAYAHVSSGASRIVTLQLRALHGGPWAHQWLELDSSRGKVTIGYGPASIPFIDAGQISIWDEQGNVEKTGIHLLPRDFSYAKPPGTGRIIGEPIPLTVAQSDALIAKQRHRKFLFPYIPIFHDCHTYVCTIQASARGKSKLPCYLLFKGYW